MSHKLGSRQISTDLVRSQQILSDLNRSCQISTDLVRSQQISSDLKRSCQVSSDLASPDQSKSDNFKMSIKLSFVTISSVMLYQCVLINLAHRLCTDFQYFCFLTISIPGDCPTYKILPMNKTNMVRINKFILNKKLQQIL